MQQNTKTLKYLKIVFLAVIIAFVSIVNILAADNVGIGTTSPDTTAILDLVSTTRGFLVPRLTSTQRDAINSPRTGLLIFNSTNSRFEFYSGSWLPLLSSGSVPLNNGQIYVGNGSNIATGVNMSGAGVLSNSGVLTLLASSVRDSNVASGAAIGVAKLAAGSNNQIIKTTSGTPGWWTPTYLDTGSTAGGDLSGTYPNPAIGNQKVTTAKIADNSVDGTKINLAGNIKGDLAYYNGTDWVRVGTGSNSQVLSVQDSVPTWQNAGGGIAAGAVDNTVRYNGTNWIPNPRVLADSTGVLTLGAGTYAGSIYLNDGAGPQTIRIATSDVAANKIYTLPDAGANANFLLSEGNQNVNGVKTFTDTLTTNQSLQILSTTSNRPELRIYEGTGTGGGQQYFAFKASAVNMSANLTYELPYVNGNANDMLAIDIAGSPSTLKWKSPAALVNSTLDSAYRRGSLINVDTGSVYLIGTIASNPVLQISNSANGGSVKITNAGSGTALFTENTGSGVTMRVNDDASDTSPFIILNDGTVGVGLASPTGSGLKMQVTGGYLRLGSGGTIDSVSGDGDLYVQDYLEVDGNATIGDAIGDTLKLYGQIKLPNMTSGNGTPLEWISSGTNTGQIVRQSSSRRYKRNIKDLEVDADLISKLHVVSFNYKSGGDRQIGLIAEEVNQIIPQLVIYDNQGRPDGVKYSQLGVLLLKEMQNQNVRIDKLEDQVAELKKLLNKLMEDKASK